MHPDRPRGFALVTAIFLLVVMAALGAFIVTVSTTQHVALALDVMGAQAYQAAQAGTEWGIASVSGSHACPASPTSFAVDSMTVTVSCSEVASGAGVEVGLGQLFQINAIACNMPTGSPLACPGLAENPNYVERGLALTVETP